MKRALTGLFTLFLLPGCSSSNPAIAPVSAQVAVVPQGPPAPAGVIAGPLGAGLRDDDRQIGAQAQIDALEKGQPRSWKGHDGVFGSVEVGAQNGACRDYTQTIYLDGRPKSGTGQGCRQADGRWTF